VSDLGDIGLVGLAVMGQNLALNMADHGYSVVVHNRSVSKTRAFLTGPAAGTGITGADTPEALVAALSTPRRIVLMVRAGSAVDAVIEDLLPHLDPGDVIVDGGNSYFRDTIRRTRALEDRGLLFVGTGISGGEEGARHGPSIMPGGSIDAWPIVQDVLQDIAAKVDDGTPCCDWVGPDGAGHYVKMVHNGIEYGDIQLLAEAYDLMHRGLGMSHDEMATTHRRGDARARRGWHPIAREDPRCRRPEGNRTLDGRIRPRARPADLSHRRGGVRPGGLRAQGRTRRRLGRAQRP
jgi:6-phosphogluconate dehydrogenase